METVLKIQNVKKYYGLSNNYTKAVDDISFSVDSGEFIGIMGASGSGKTTLLNILSTIDEASSGSVELDGKDMTQINEHEMAQFRRENLGFIFQDYNLLDTLTLHDNIALALTITNTPIAEVDQKVIHISKQLGIENILNKYPYEVSGGQQQRAACARAMINSPKLILADEPTGALDSHASQILLENMSMMNKQWKATILMVTHDAFSASYCKRIFFLKDGKIYKEIERQSKAQDIFYSEILDVLARFGGGQNVQ